MQNGAKTGMKKEMILYFIIISVVSLGLGLSDSVFNNYFKEVYQVTTVQRGFIEFPRELPGLIVVFVMTGFSFLGNIRLAIAAQALSFIGLLVLGLVTPAFAVMLVFVFINSMGMHLFMPLSDGIGLSMVESPEVVGKRMGQYNGVKTLFGMIAGIIVFIGFKTGFFSFESPVKLVFLISAGLFIVSFCLFLYLQKHLGKAQIVRKKVQFLFRREYKFYYILAVLNGVQKQILFVYAPWVLIDLLGKKADTLALLGIIGAFAGTFFISAVGRWIDRFGIKKMMYADALSYIFVYLAYALLSGLIFSGIMASTGLSVLLVFSVYVIDKLSMQLGMVKVVYLNAIAHAPGEVTQTLSTGISMDHVVSILFAYMDGLIWQAFGPQYVFIVAAVLSFINLFVAIMAKIETVDAQKAIQ